MTNRMLLRLYYTTGVQSIFPGYTTPSTRLRSQLAMIILIEWRIPDLDLVY